MEKIKIKQAKKIQGQVTPPADKSISHRAVMLGSIAQGRTVIENFLFADDCLRSVEAFCAMGVDITRDEKNGLVTVEGKGLYGLRKPAAQLYLGNSGTSMRLLLGVLAGCEFEATVSGDESLSRRPMKRVTEPLRQMGAEIKGKDNADFAPLIIKGRKPLKPLEYVMPVASAQVKSAILLAGLYADGVTKISEPIKSRDHSERMLRLFGADIKIDGETISIKGSPVLKSKNIRVPSDISSAAFFIVAAAILPGSSLTIKNLGLNPTRTGIIDVLKAMGAKITISNFRDDYEPIGDVTIAGSGLRATAIEADIIPRLIDELPVIMVAAAVADGVTTIRGAGELRVKETDRINSMVTNLKKIGADITSAEDNILIHGPTRFKAASVESFGDHRTAMSMAVAGLASDGGMELTDTQCISTSFPSFEAMLRSVAV
ncbi:MAG: 3-phosphoshikimate 1-carboxyvinyltransferase [Candidatus Omnitrophota bacterium]